MLPPLPLMLASQENCPSQAIVSSVTQSHTLPTLSSTFNLFFFFFNYLGDISLNSLGFSRPEITTDPSILKLLSQLSKAKILFL